MIQYSTDISFARQMDAEDSLAGYRQKFHIPKMESGEDSIYFCGNSLGLQPVSVAAALQQELDDWARLGVEGHFRGKNPWKDYHERLTQQLAHVVGAKPIEVVAMNSLTVNLHLMMVSFYRPTKTRYKIMIEGGAFPSDQYAVKSQIAFHGFDPASALIELEPREGEDTLRTEDIETAIAKAGDSLALVMLGGVNYYTGQLYDMKKITEAGHRAGAVVGFDLAHAAGNAVLKLHDWNVDFAVWCSYKYLNAGPGAIAGCFVHERYAEDHSLPRFSGWWGHDKSSRFIMGPDFVPIAGAEGWQMSNPPIFSLTPVKESLDMFVAAGMENLRAKSLRLTGYLEFLLDSLKSDSFRVLTPRDAEQRGCQLSVVMKKEGKKVFNALEKQGVIFDWREPDCIRVAPVPMYNSFMDVYRFVEMFKHEAVKS